MRKKGHFIRTSHHGMRKKGRFIRTSHHGLEDLASEEPALNDNLLLTHSIGKEVDKFLFSFMSPIFHL